MHYITAAKDKLNVKIENCVYEKNVVLIRNLFVFVLFPI